MAERTETVDQAASGSLYLRDLGALVKEKALDAQRAKEVAEGGDEYDVQLGRLMALQEVVSLMQEQAASFEIPLEQLGLDDIDPYDDLR